MPRDATKFIRTNCPDDKQNLRVWPHLPCLPFLKIDFIIQNGILGLWHNFLKNRSFSVTDFYSLRYILVRTKERRQ